MSTASADSQVPQATTTLAAATGDSEAGQTQLDFHCHLENARTLANLLQAIALPKAQTVHLLITSKGMRFTVEEPRVQQASWVMEATQFATYQLAGDEVQLRLPLSTLLDCITIYGTTNTITTSTAQMVYSRTMDHFALQLEDSTGIVTEAMIRQSALDEEPVDFMAQMGTDERVNLVMQSSYLRDAFNELDWDTNHIDLLVSPEAPFFRLSTAAAMGSCQVEYPKEGGVFSEFSCSRQVSFRYKPRLLKPVVKALAIAKSVGLRIGGGGLLGLVLLVKHEDNSMSCVNFYIAACADSEDSDDE